MATSCSSNLDFNQNTGDLSPYFEVKDIFNAEFEINSANLIQSGISSNYNLPPQTILFNINEKLKDEGIVKSIKEVDFHVTFNNTTNNKCSITVVFRTDYYALNQYTKTVIVPPNTINQDIVFSETDIPNLKSVTNIQISGSMTISGTPLSGTLIVNSDAWIYLKL